MRAWQDARVIALVFFVVAMVASIDKYTRAPRMHNGREVAQYNNFVIYRNASLHLTTGENLYAEYPDAQNDVFLYSPTFAAAFAPLGWLPTLAGLCLWNGLNAVLLALALRALPAPAHLTACMAWFVMKDLFTNLQNSQANGLVAALMILTFVAWQRKWLPAAAICLTLAAFTKPFGLAVGLFWLVFPQRMRFVGWFGGSCLVLGALPLLLTTPALLGEQYQNWLERLQVMHGLSAGISVMGILETWFGITGVKLPVVGLGLVLLLLPLCRTSQYQHRLFQLSLLASVLIWVVIFNHEAESPSFVIAAAGVCVWYFSQPITRWTTALAVFAFTLTSFSSSDLFPDYLQGNWIVPYHLKALPCVVIWGVLQVELMWRDYAEAATAGVEPAKPTARHELAHAA